MSITKSVVKSPASAKFFSWLNIFLEKLVMYKCGSKSIYSATFYYFLLHSKGNILRFYFIFTVLTGKAQSFTIVFSLLGLLLCNRFFSGIYVYKPTKLVFLISKVYQYGGLNSFSDACMTDVNCLCGRTSGFQILALGSLWWANTRGYFVSTGDVIIVKLCDTEKI